MMTDPDWRVRLSVCRRVPFEQLQAMTDDEDEDVRAVARQRIEQTANQT
jgi:hypothetical protein